VTVQTFQEQLLETSGVIADILGTVFDSFDFGLKAFGTGLKLSQTRNVVPTATMRAEILVARFEYESYNATRDQLDALKRCVELAEKVVRTVGISDASDCGAPQGWGRQEKVAMLIYDALVKDESALSVLQQLERDGGLCESLLRSFHVGVQSSIWEMVDRELEIRKLASEGKEDLRQLKEDTAAFALAKAFPRNQEQMRMLYMLVADLCYENVSRIEKSEDNAIAVVARFLRGFEVPFYKRVRNGIAHLPAYKSDSDDVDSIAPFIVLICGCLFAAILVLVSLFAGVK